MSEWIDVSMPLANGMTVWPGDAPPRFEQTMWIERGDPCNLTRMDVSVHTGTHMDAPRHFLREGAGMESLPLEAVMGPARVVETSHPEAVQAGELPGDLERGERILFKTPNSARDLLERPFAEDFVYISREAAVVLAEAGVRTVGVDGLSVGGFHQDLVETHEILLGAGIWIIEGLDLRRIEPGRYELACLPLKIVGSDGAPARAALRRV
ncbi:MAG: cyclase family protein [Bryobacteraceae bacterium]|nr:cyclase family protein [Solibacteraceae bacterium]MCO5349373.1 cyclase family protein [Bryobacteraceae bacterium]